MPITDSDLARLVGAGFDPYEFVEFVSVSSLQCEYPDVRLEHGYFYMCLARREDKSCVFAVDSEGGLRCSVHGNHPRLCQIYPMDPLSGSVRRKHVCPPKMRYSPSVEDVFSSEQAELSEYSNKVRRWNSASGLRRCGVDFIGYLLR